MRATESVRIPERSGHVPARMAHAELATAARPGPLASATFEARSEVEAALRRVNAELRRHGMPVMSGDGKMIRPLLAHAAAGASEHPRDERFWYAAAAIQLAHEASLVHDDIVDGASVRRGRASLAAERGVGAALVHGDHLLTASYRIASWTGSSAFQARFAESVERTVAGELAQGRFRGELLDGEAYRQIVLGKSGELLGCSLAASALLADSGDAPRRHELGRQIGLAYQMLDDLLDYCPQAATGKTPFADYVRRHWTWVLDAWPDARFDLPAAEVHARLHAGGDDSIMRRALLRYELVCTTILCELRAELPQDVLAAGLLEQWCEHARRAVHAEAVSSEAVDSNGAEVSAARMRQLPERTLAAAPAPLALPDADDWLDSMRTHARSFRFASWLFPPAERRKVERVYAYCRFTDDLADGNDARDTAAALARLDAWESLSRAAYDGQPSGNVMLDRTMSEMADAGVPFECASELIEGMRMDLRGERYGTYDELRLYAYRVAGVVGVWLTRLFGVHEAAVLERAVALGTAMQLTNIARDVGEDLDAGRVYLPQTWLAAVGLDEAALHRMRANGSITPDYAVLIERLLLHAEAEYDRAFAAVPALPRFFQRPVAVAARVYRGIHGRIRANGYDNLNRRAATSALDKVRHAAAAGLQLLRARRQWLSPGRAGATALLLACAFPFVATAQTAPCPPLPTPRQHLETAELRLATGGESDVALLDVVRARFFTAVEDASSIDAGIATLDQLERAFPGAGVADAALRSVYRGALTMLRAKHGRWPPQRLRDTRSGLGLLDSATARAPDSYEVRYLRLTGGFYLPQLFGRRSEVREDMQALTALLPRVPVEARGALYREVVVFVIENGEHSADSRAALRALLDEFTGAAAPCE